MEKRRNLMGSEVAEGYQCKPVKRDPHRPILHFRHQIFLCTGPRCASKEDMDSAPGRLRSLVEEVGLDRGQHRIKITRSNCFGACRFRRVSVIYENGDGTNNCVWLKYCQSMGDDEWKEVFRHLREGIPLKESRFAGLIIPMEAVTPDGTEGAGPS